jgi:exodeoxyribonuclease III
MRVTSWNVNGIRAVARKELFRPLFSEVKPDILLLQETKAEEQQIPEAVRNIPEFVSFFNASQMRSGYSGTAIYSKKHPSQVTRGMGKDAYDQEGRVITAFFEGYVICNIYFPNGGQGPERLRYKLDFYEVFLEYVESLKKYGLVLWGGDINTAHEAVDLARPRENEKNTGFLPEERAWLDAVVRCGWIDTFRHFYPTKEGMYTYWDMKTRARERNVGWRIDYIFASQAASDSLTSATIHAHILGSDHCPISVDVDM